MIANKVLAEWRGNFSDTGESEIINECVSYDHYEYTYAMPNGYIQVYVFRDGSIVWLKQVNHLFVGCGVCKNSKSFSKLLKKEGSCYKVA